MMHLPHYSASYKMEANSMILILLSFPEVREVYHRLKISIEESSIILKMLVSVLERCTDNNLNRPLKSCSSKADYLNPER